MHSGAGISQVASSWGILITRDVSSFPVQTSREPGWLEGTLNGKRGLIPQNYVKLL